MIEEGPEDLMAVADVQRVLLAMLLALTGRIRGMAVGVPLADGVAVLVMATPRGLMVTPLLD